LGVRIDPNERQQLDLFRALPGRMAPRDSQDLMSWPFFSLSKSRRVLPIDFRMGEVSIRVEATPEHGMATIWDADILIWAASQIVEARDHGLMTSRLMTATPYEILAFIGRGDSLRDYDRLKASLDRLQATTIATSIRQPTIRRRHRFSWINEWKERLDGQGRSRGIELILPDWFYNGVINDAFVLTIDRAYFDLTGGIERWLYLKSGSLSSLKRFAFEMRGIVARQPLPGYRLGLERAADGTQRLTFAPHVLNAGRRPARRNLSTEPVDNLGDKL
jgi:plasmid replication initiation protein